jgi:hypothetical protein
MGEVVEVGGEHGFVKCADLKRMHLVVRETPWLWLGCFLVGGIGVGQLDRNLHGFVRTSPSRRFSPLMSPLADIPVGV